MKHPARTTCSLVASVLLLSALNTAGAQTSKPFARISNAECYALDYSDPVKPGSSQLFPTAVALLSGVDSGAATGVHGTRLSDVDWAGINEYAKWKALSADSLEITFSGHAEGISIRASRATGTLSGRATWWSDLIDGGPPDSSRLTGRAEECPQGLRQSAR